MGIRDSKVRHPNRARRRNVAAMNLTARKQRSAAQQLQRLDSGVHRAVKERVRLQNAILEENIHFDGED